MSWEVEKNQLVKCKDTGLYLQLYISINLKVNIQYTCVYDITENEKIISTTEGADWDNYGIANCCVIEETTLDSIVHAANMWRT